MALLTSLNKKENMKSRWRSTTKGEYAVTEDTPGQPILHIVTYGSATRQNKDSCSQVIQIDRKHAAILARVLAETFDL